MENLILIIVGFFLLICFFFYHQKEYYILLCGTKFGTGKKPARNIFADSTTGCHKKLYYNSMFIVFVECRGASLQDVLQDT